MSDVDDVEAIRRLKARYFRTMDSKDWDGMRQVFTDDVVIDTSEAGGRVLRGADEFMAFLRETLAGAVTVHQGHMPEIDLTTETTATGIWALNDIVIWPNGVRLDGYGHYYETYEKGASGWRIKSSRLTRLHTDFADAGGELMTVAVVTGGASGFGLALSERCAALGMQVALLDLDGERAVTEAAQVADAFGVEALGMAVDVADAASVDAAATAVDEQFGVVDLVVSNVGVQLFGAVEALTDDEWRWLLDVNVTGSARVARSFLRLLRKSKRGRLAFTTSSSILDPASRLGAYQASKFAVWGLAETLRLELAGDGIGVSVIFPSAMITRHLETSEGAQPDHLRRPIANDGDFDAMIASNPGMTTMLVTAEGAAGGVIEAVLADEPYVITHGDLTEAVMSRSAKLTKAAEASRDH